MAGSQDMGVGVAQLLPSPQSLGAGRCSLGVGWWGANGMDGGVRNTYMYIKLE